MVYLLKVGSKESDLKAVEEANKYWIKVAFLTCQYFLRLHFNKATQRGIIFISLCGVSAYDFRLRVKWLHVKTDVHHEASEEQHLHSLVMYKF